jgi:hypothetical protein
LFEDFNGIPFPQFFGNKEAFHTISIWDKIGWTFMTVGSFAWSPFNTWGVLFELLGGDYDVLTGLDKLIWIWYRLYVLNYNAQVFQRNVSFLLLKEAAAVASALWFTIFFPFNFFLRLTADGLFDADFEELDEKNLDYSLSQATSYHYWEGKESHGLFSMIWTNYVTDRLRILVGWPLLFVAFPIYQLVKWATILLFPLILTIKVATPWKENQGETDVMWWVDAIELGLYDPADPPTNIWEIEAARTQYLSRFDDVEFDGDEPDSDEDED